MASSSSPSFPRHEGHSMDGMGDMGNSSTSGGHDGSMGSMMMAMVFQTQTATPLYSSAWTPGSAGAYAGTCIFLVVLAVVARLLLAARALQEARWLDRDLGRRYVAAPGKASLAEALSRDPDAKQHVALSVNGVEESVCVVERRGHVARPWRFSVDPVRAVMDTVIVGVGYLLCVVAPPSSLPFCSCVCRSRSS